MNPGLVWLLRNAPRTFGRGLRRRFRGVKGVLLAVFIVGFVLLGVAPSVVESVLNPQPSPQLAERARAFGPLSLLLMTGMSLLAPAQRRGGLYFRPAEIGMLFPAPVSRRELLAYHVLSRAQIQVMSGLWVSLFVVRYAPTWYGCIVGVTLALLFLQLLSQAVALVTAAAGRRLAWPLRWGLLLAVLLAIGSAAARSFADAGVLHDPAAAFHTLAADGTVRIVTLPFRPFAETFAATSPLDVALWGAVSCAVLLALVVLVARLDVAYEEAALSVSRDVRRRLLRMRSGGGAFAMLGPSRARFAVPSLPSFGGAGPVAWRQCVEIVRNARAVLTSLLFLLLWPAVVGGAVLLATSDGDASGGKAAAMLLPMLVLLSVVSTQNVGFDFRRDLDRIAYLRSLPVAPFAVAAGQVAPSALLLALLQWLAISLVVLGAGLLPALAVPAILVLLLPLAWLVIALDNLLFLLLPHRIDPDDAGNVGFMGRLMLTMALKLFGLFALLVAAGGAGALAGFLLGRSVVAGVLAGVAVIVAADVVLTWLVARAFDAFDPGRDTPA